jgi:hypothetical protein
MSLIFSRYKDPGNLKRQFTLLDRGISSWRAFIFSLIRSRRLCRYLQRKSFKLWGRHHKTCELKEMCVQTTDPLREIMDLSSTRSLCRWSTDIFLGFRRFKINILLKQDKYK